ncbi:hypothetical protein HPSA_00215 [Helicobacter pylori SouthAfrica7]|uniref:Uncharacterized protein n=1 Tax=Helicobacter pylori (strain SouthAfrica7) TaxID=907239 RepID=E8QTP6_HELPW|nr:hypothetical protein HPSA_00215 [Helicobacter pylori SouthAfrica7]
MRFALNFKRFQKTRRVSVLIFHKELGKVRGFLLDMKNKLLKGYDNNGE